MQLPTARHVFSLSYTRYLRTSNGFFVAARFPYVRHRTERRVAHRGWCRGRSETQLAYQHRELIGMSSDFVPAVGAPQNTLLAALPAFDWKRVKRSLSLLETPAGKTLCELESRLDYAYFPTTSIISVRHVADDGASTEVATIGNEGVVGVSLFWAVKPGEPSGCSEQRPGLPPEEGNSPRRIQSRRRNAAFAPSGSRTRCSPRYPRWRPAIGAIPSISKCAAGC